MHNIRQTKFTKDFQKLLFQDEIQTRIFNIDEEQLCYGRPNVIFPKKAKNLNDEWVWVVNIDNYTQSVEVIILLKNYQTMFMIFRLNVYPTIMFIRKNYSAMQQCNLDYLQVEECDNATISEDFGRDRHVSIFPFD